MSNTETRARPGREVARDRVLFPETLEEVQRMCQVILRSGLAGADFDTWEKIFAVVQYGREQGVPPMASLRYFYVMYGQIGVSAEYMAARIWQAGHGYRVEESTDTRCVLTLRRDTGETVTQTFTMEDAQRAGILGRNTIWRQYPQIMLFWRTMAMGARMLMPDAFGGLHTPDELDPTWAPADVDALQSAYKAAVEATGANDLPLEHAPSPAQQAQGSTAAEDAAPQAPAPERPYSPERVRKGIRQRIKWESTPAPPEATNQVAAVLGSMFPDETTKGKNVRRHAVLWYLLGPEHHSTKTLTPSMCHAIMEWAGVRAANGVEWEWTANEIAAEEGARCVIAYQEATGDDDLMIMYEDLYPSPEPPPADSPE